MKTYNAVVEVRKSFYMEDDNTTFTKNFTVQADSEKEAENKIYKYYNDKSESYSVYYDVLDIEFSIHLD